MKDSNRGMYVDHCLDAYVRFTIGWISGDLSTLEKEDFIKHLEEQMQVIEVMYSMVSCRRFFSCMTRISLGKKRFIDLNGNIHLFLQYE